MNGLKLQRIKLFSKLDAIFEEEDDVEHSCCDFDLLESEEVILFCMYVYLYMLPNCTLRAIIVCLFLALIKI